MIHCLSVWLLATSAAQALTVDPDLGNNTFSAVFDAPVGERIAAVSSQVGCDLKLQNNEIASGRCWVPLTSVMVDNEPTKTEHFTQWATNKKTEPKECKLEASFTGVKLASALAEKTPVHFAGEVTFTVCGRARVDKGKEHVEGSAVRLPGSGGGKPTVRIRAHVEGFDREKYQIGPKWTDGWISRVQQLAPVVAAKGTLDISVFAKDRAPEAAP